MPGARSLAPTGQTHVGARRPLADHRRGSTVVVAPDVNPSPKDLAMYHTPSPPHAPGGRRETPLQRLMRSGILQGTVSAAAMFIVGAGAFQPAEGATAQVALKRFVGPTSSQPLAMSADNSFLVAANPDNNTVSFFDLRG